MNAMLAANPSLCAALVRLKSGAQEPTDFPDFIKALRYYERQATLNGLRGIGELGVRDRGAALCYGQILSMIDEAALPEKPEPDRRPPDFGPDQETAPSAQEPGTA